MPKLVFDQNHPYKRYGKALGFVFSYLLFTTILFYVLHYLRRVPPTFTFFHMVLVTLGILVVAEIVMRSLQ